ncbi:MAG: DUF1792 domain-containing protein [Cyanobacteria bacterium SIG31]|nr:DUF1792 domain-containing protein [Cyanobacteria bacterium SIG31]
MNKFRKQYSIFVRKIYYKIKFRNIEKELPKIKNNIETINELINTEKSIIRFGDGEFFFMEGEDLCFQEYNKQLAEMLKQIFYTDIPQLLIGTVWLYYGYKKDLRYSVYKYILKFLKEKHNKSLKYYNYNKTYWSSFISIPFSQYEKYPYEEHYTEIRQIWDSKEITVITGDRVYENIKYNIFDNAKEINYIYGPTTNAYSQYEELKQKILNIPQNNILIFALGPCGKALAFEAFSKGYRVLDLGHIIKDFDAYNKAINMTEYEVRECLKIFFDSD